MFACPMAKVDTEIILTTPLESVDYVKMTWDVLAKHEVRVDIHGNFERIVNPCQPNYQAH